MPDLFLPWAKLGRGAEAIYPGKAHPVLCHLLDVGVCARAIWTDVLTAAARRRWADALGLEPDAAGGWIAFWAGSHDIGKVSPAFQGKDEKAKARLRAGLTFGVGDAPHGQISQVVLEEALAASANWPGLEKRFARDIAKVVGGHHGVIATDEQVDGLLKSDAVGSGRWNETRSAMLAELAAAVGVPDLPAPRPPDSCDRGFFLFLAGLIAVADWLGSNKDHFKAQGCDGWDAARWADYRAAADRKSREVLHDLGWTGWKRDAEGPLPFGELFPQIKATPRPLQTLTAALADAAPGPRLTLIEAPMGEGKTEAALYVADRATHAADGRGFYIALPTQATGNGMFDRARQFLSERYPAQRVNLQLSHGGAELNERFQELREKGKASLHDQSDDDAPGAVVAEEWFAKDKKQGLLAPFAVGTIDQALLAVLQVKFGFVRLFGLAGKTVILDEVHAYDAYMSVLLGRLLRWLAALGCPVVLLSATLPAAKRRELVAAYLGKEPDSAALEADYPRITTADPTSGLVKAITIPTAAGTVEKEIRLVRLPPDDLPARLRAALAGGGCAAVICNTVGRAQEVYGTLVDALPGVEVSLFHARFPQEDRAKIEKRVLDAYGPPGKGERPPCSVLVATQVVEQSLDLDFDLMVSEHAPIDLLLQRSGRLHRHDRTRPAGLTEPQLWLLEPEELIDGVPGFGAFEDRGKGGVYARHILLRTWVTLAGRDTATIPAEMEALVESVYGEPGDPPPDAAWQAALDGSQAAMQEARETSEANACGALIPSPEKANLLRQCSRRLDDEDDPQTHSSMVAKTREMDPTVSLVLLYDGPAGPSTTRDGTGPVNLDRKPDAVTVAALVGRSVSLSRKEWVRHFANDRHRPAGWAECGPLRFHRVALLDADRRYVCKAGTLRLDPRLGVVYE